MNAIKKKLLQGIVLLVGSVSMIQIFASDPETNTKQMIRDLEKMETMFNKLKKSADLQLELGTNIEGVHDLTREIEDIQFRLLENKERLILQLDIQAAKRDGGGGV